MSNFDLIDQLINPFVTEKLEKVYQKDEEYLTRVKEEDLIYKKLREKLSDEQAAQLEQYFIAANATTARKEALTYIQGMKDLLALLKALS